MIPLEQIPQKFCLAFRVADGCCYSLGVLEGGREMPCAEAHNFLELFRSAEARLPRMNAGAPTEKRKLCAP